jgi:ribonucleoside-triphosphate reductase
MILFVKLLILLWSVAYVGLLLLALSDLGDDRIRSAKMGSWWIDDVQRALANNSAVYHEKPPIDVFLREWTSTI